MTSLPFILIKKVKTRKAAMDEALKMCTCRRKSFSGVRYIDEEKNEFEITWKDVDQYKRSLESSPNNQSPITRPRNRPSVRPNAKPHPSLGNITPEMFRR